MSELKKATKEEIQDKAGRVKGFFYKLFPSLLDDAVTTENERREETARRESIGAGGRITEDAIDSVTTRMSVVEWHYKRQSQSHGETVPLPGIASDSCQSLSFDTTEYQGGVTGGIVEELGLRRLAFAIGMTADGRYLDQNAGVFLIGVSPDNTPTTAIKLGPAFFESLEKTDLDLLEAAAATVLDYAHQSVQIDQFESARI